jgi:hypothetical protein
MGWRNSEDFAMSRTALLLAAGLWLAINASAQSTPGNGTPTDAPNPSQSAASKQQGAREARSTQHARAAEPTARDQAESTPSKVSAGAQKTYRDRKKVDAGTACTSARTTPDGKLDCGMTGKSATTKPKHD